MNQKLRLWNEQVTKKTFKPEQINTLQTLLSKSGLYAWEPKVRYDEGSRSVEIGYIDGLGTFIYRFVVFQSKAGFHVFYNHKAGCLYPQETHLPTLEQVMSSIEKASIK